MKYHKIVNSIHITYMWNIENSRYIFSTPLQYIFNLRYFIFYIFIEDEDI